MIVAASEFRAQEPKLNHCLQAHLWTKNLQTVPGQSRKTTIKNSRG